MGITGNLRTMELAELLQWLSQAQKTGTLVVENGRVVKRIFFRDGMIISSASSDPREYLGSFLVSRGLITDHELTQAMKMQADSKMLLGKILVTIGAVSEQDVHRMLRQKAEEGIFDVFAWPEGEFRFLDRQLPAEEMVPIALDVTGIVLEGMQRIDEWRRVREVIPSAQCIPVAVAAFDESEIDTGGRQVLGQIDDSRTIEEIAAALHATEFFVCRHLFQQYQAGRVKFVRPRVAPATGGEPPIRDKPTPAGGTTVDADSLAEAASRFLAKRELEQALRHLRAARCLEPDSKKLGASLTFVEEGVRHEIERAGVVPQAVPSLARTMEELTKLRISPQEGFLLTRVNGSDPIQSLLKLSPMPALDTLLIFWKLASAGHIRLQQPS